MKANGNIVSRSSLNSEYHAAPDFLVSVKYLLVFIELLRVIEREGFKVKIKGCGTKYFHNSGNKRIWTPAIIFELYDSMLYVGVTPVFLDRSFRTLAEAGTFTERLGKHIEKGDSFMRVMEEAKSTKE